MEVQILNSDDDVTDVEFEEVKEVSNSENNSFFKYMIM